MPNPGTNPNPKKTHSIVDKLSNLPITQIRPRNPNLPQPLSKPHKRKKNPNLQSIKSVSSHLANCPSGSLQKQNSVLYKAELLLTRQKNRQSISGKVPFANATNSKPVKSFSINSNKPKTEVQRQLGLKESKQLLTSPKESERSKELRQKPIQQKQLQPSEFTRKRIKTYRIHLSSSSSKDNSNKQKNINSHNRILSTSQQRQLLPIQGLHLSKQKAQCSPGIDSDLTNKIITNRQKSSHSFMIRKKINSTVLQSVEKNQRNNKNQWDQGNMINGSKCYRKDRFVKDEVVETQKTSRGIEQGNQFLRQTKTRGRQQQIAQQQLNENLPTQQSQKSTKRLQPLKPGKSLKMRKKKFSKPQQQDLIYDQIFTEPNNNDKPENDVDKKFQQSLESNFQLVKSRTVEYEKKKQREVEMCLMRGREEEEKSGGREWVDNNGEPEVCEIQAFYEMIVEQHLQLKPQQNQIPQKKPHKQTQLLTTTNNHIKLCKKRVSSIRALKSLYRNIQSQPKTQLGESSRNGEFSKRKEKEAPCLTHKIKWGNSQGKRKEMNEGKNEDGVGGRDYKVHGDFLRLELESIQIEKVQEKSKNIIKKARFMDEEMQKDQQEQQSCNKKKCFSKKSQSLSIQNTQSPKPYQSIGSRSMILFQDPGLSVIVKKNSSLESSAYVYTTIEQDVDRNQESNYKRENRRYEKEDGRLESLKELFLELKSQQSIDVMGEEQI